MSLIKGDKISEGAYGVVYNVVNDDSYVIKRNLIKKSVLGVMSIKELDINMMLRNNENICKLVRICYGKPIKDNFSPRQLSMLKDDVVYFFFEKCDMNLEDWCNKSYDINKIYNMMLKISLALEYVHNKGIIHRDIKPKNILVKGDEIKLIDFGISTYYTSRENSDFNICAVDYRAPEVIFEEEYDKSIDIWSLGCVFLELINKEYLFDNDDVNNSIADSIKILNKKFHKLFSDEQLNSLGIERINSPDVLINITTEEFEASIGSYDDFMSLINNIFVYNGRFNITEVLNHKFFNKSRTEIYNYRNKYNFYKEAIVFKKDCKEREIVNAFVLSFLDKKDKPWFRYRTLFQIIDIFDRLVMLDENVDDIYILLDAIYYLCVKIFVRESQIPLIKHILTQDVKQVIKKEEYIINRLIDSGENIYRRTVFEESDIYNIDINDLLIFYCKVTYHATPLQYISDFLHA